MKPNRTLVPYAAATLTMNPDRHAVFQYAATVIVELISFPIPPTECYPDGSIMVRLRPTDPGMLMEVPLEALSPCASKPRLLYLHYGRVNGRGSFPSDMLRYDGCVPATFSVQEDLASGITQAQPFSGLPLLVLKVSPRRTPDWTYERWSSFNWGIQADRCVVWLPDSYVR